MGDNTLAEQLNTAMGVTERDELRVDLKNARAEASQLKGEIAVACEYRDAVHADVKDALNILGGESLIDGYLTTMLRERCKIAAARLRAAEELASVCERGTRSRAVGEFDQWCDDADAALAKYREAGR